MKKHFICSLVFTLCLLLISGGSLFTAEPKIVSIPINQILQSEGSKPSEDIFTYQIESWSDNAPTPTKATISLQGNESMLWEFGSFSDTGIYKYKVSLLDYPQENGYKIDAGTYFVDVYVGGMIDVVISTVEGTKVDAIDYHQMYSVLSTSVDDMHDISVIKEIMGSPNSKATFAFVLEAQNINNPMPSGSAEGTKTIEISGTGRNTFGTWTYSQTGTYYYKVYEEDTKQNNYKYDVEEYLITDTVTHQNGKLYLDRVITNQSKKRVYTFLFVNTYQADVLVPPTGPNTGDTTSFTFIKWSSYISLSLLVLSSWYLIMTRKRQRDEA